MECTASIGNDIPETITKRRYRIYFNVFRPIPPTWVCRIEKVFYDPKSKLYHFIVQD